MLAGWAGSTKTLSRQGRRALLFAPIVYAVLWAALAVGPPDAARVRRRCAARQGDISSSRFGIWSNTVALIASHPWLGVGWGVQLRVDADALSGSAGGLLRPHAQPAAAVRRRARAAARAARAGAARSRALAGLEVRRAQRRAADCDRAARRVHDRADDGRAQPVRVPAVVRLLPVPTAFAFGLCLGGEAPAAAGQGRSEALRAAAAVLVVGACLSCGTTSASSSFTRRAAMRRRSPTHRRGPAELVLRPPCRLCRRHDPRSVTPTRTRPSRA